MVSVRKKVSAPAEDTAGWIKGGPGNGSLLYFLVL